MRRFSAFAAALILLAWLAPTTTAVAGETNFQSKNTSKKSPPAQILAPSAKLVNGEKLKYDVRWFGIPVGSGEVQILEARLPDGTPGYEITALTGANDFLNSFYPMKDNLRSLVSAEGLYAVSSEKDLTEGRYRAHEKVTFDPAAKTAQYESFTNGSKKQIPTGGRVRDILGGFYWFRLQDVKKGAEVKFHVFSDEKSWVVRLSVLRTDRLEIRNLGTFDVFVVEPHAEFKGILVDRGKALVYFTADSRRLPVKIELKTPYGPVIAILQKLPEGVV